MYKNKILFMYLFNKIYISIIKYKYYIIIKIIIKILFNKNIKYKKNIKRNTISNI